MKANEAEWAGAAGTETAPAGELDSKAARKARKEAQRLARDAQRRPDAWERWRVVTEAIGHARQVVEIADHRARYALVIIGVLNAGVVALMARAHLISSLAPTVKPFVIGAAALHGVVSVLLVLHAIDCLRPRQLDRQAMRREGAPTDLPGLLTWENVVEHEPHEYLARWEQVRLAELNAEAEVTFRILARLIQLKYRALRRLYQGLAVTVVSAAALLALATWFALA